VDRAEDLLFRIANNTSRDGTFLVPFEGTNVVADDLRLARAKRSLDKDITDATNARQWLLGQRELDADAVAAYDTIIRALQRAREALR
jgi:hypothetical protein